MSEPDWAEQAREIIDTPVAYGSDVNEHYSMEPHRHLIERALRAAYASGRKAGLEDAQAIAEKHRTYGSPGTKHGRGLNVAVVNVMAEISEAIRALTDKGGGEK